MVLGSFVLCSKNNGYLKIEKLEDLEIWQVSRKLAKLIFKLQLKNRLVKILDLRIKYELLQVQLCIIKLKVLEGGE